MGYERRVVNEIVTLQVQQWPYYYQMMQRIHIRLCKYYIRRQSYALAAAMLMPLSSIHTLSYYA